MEWLLPVITLLAMAATVLYAYYAIQTRDKWKAKASNVFFAVGQHAHTSSERIWGYRNSLMAGNAKAEKFYACANIAKFMNEQPMEPFYLSGLDIDNVPIVFCDYYFPSRFSDFMSYEQRQFSQKVYDFKGGKDSCSRYFKEAIAHLNLQQDVTVLFMSCSSKEKYLNRFGTLSKALSYVDGLHPELYGMTYLYSRESKHKTRERDSVSASDNISINANVIGTKSILVDDVMSSGTSLKEYILELRKFGVIVVGAVFLGRTISFPDKDSIHQLAEEEESQCDPNSKFSITEMLKSAF